MPQVLGLKACLVPASCSRIAVGQTIPGYGLKPGDRTTVMKASLRRLQYPINGDLFLKKKMMYCLFGSFCVRIPVLEMEAFSLPFLTVINWQPEEAR